MGRRFVSSPDHRWKACLVCLWTLRTFRVDLVVMAKATGGAQVTTFLENEPMPLWIFKPFTEWVTKP